jgi:ribonuclease HII
LCKKVRIVRIPPERIDQYVLRRKRLMRLNLLEAETMASITKKLCPQVAYVDSCDVNALRYGRTISKLAGDGIRIRSFHKADVRFPIVSAASIIAKVARDREIIRLVHEYGDIGTGYPSDPKTIAFLKAWLRKEPSPPLCARHSWSTFERLSPTLGDFPTV